MLQDAKSALILVDLQNDFCAGGSLAVPQAAEIIPYANQLQAYFSHVIASKDWHPADHASFADNHVNKKVGDKIIWQGVEQILWPRHCVQGTFGAEFYPGLVTDKIAKIIYKGTDKNADSYSAFFDNAKLRATGLFDYLRELQITDLYIMGLATDYCVAFTCLDAQLLGFNTHLIMDACRAVELHPGDTERTLAHLKQQGVTLLQVVDLLDNVQKITISEPA